MAFFPAFRTPKALNKFRGPISAIRREDSFRINFRFRINKQKSFFFDRKQWDAILTREQRAALSRAGAFIMTTARGSIRRRKYHSRPGQPPTSWAGLLKKGPEPISFWFDPIRMSVVVGPGYLPSAHKESKPLDQPSIPAILEFGGRIQHMAADRYSFAKERTRRGQRLKAGRTVKVAARPYMWPAYLKNESDILLSFRDMLGRSPAAVRRAG